MQTVTLNSLCDQGNSIAIQIRDNRRCDRLKKVILLVSSLALPVILYAAARYGFPKAVELAKKPWQVSALIYAAGLTSVVIVGGGLVGILYCIKKVHDSHNRVQEDAKEDVCGRDSYKEDMKEIFERSVSPKELETLREGEGSKNFTIDLSKSSLSASQKEDFTTLATAVRLTIISG